MTTLLSIPEVAERLSCSRWHVYKLIETGELSVVDIATPGSSQTKSRVREADLESYLDRITAHSSTTLKG